MTSREYWGPPPRRGRSSPPPAWNQHYEVPPPHFDECRGPPDHYFNHPPPSRPPHYYEDESPSWHHDERPHYHHPPFPPMDRPSSRGNLRGGRRGRGRGEGGPGRGQAYGRSNSYEQRSNGPKQSAQNDYGRKSNVAQGTNKSSSDKPAWLTQSVNQDKTSTSNSSGSKPAWLTQSVTQTNTNSSNSNESKPAWLTTSVAKPNNVITSSSSAKPAWLQSNNTNTQSTTTNTSQATVATLTNTTCSQSPPPPPSHPPPLNQPKLLPESVPSVSTQIFQAPANGIQVTKPANKAKNKALVEVKVAAPGEVNFISFKNSLQEYSQKKGFPVPVYRTFKNSYGQSAKVEAAKKTFQSTGIQKDKKEAEQNAAYEALKGLGLLDPTVPFTSSAKAGTKRPQLTPQLIAKKLKGEIPSLSFNNSPNYKCQLNEFCQKFHLPVPTYETVHETGGFMTTLVYNKKVYLSTSPQATKKAAEQNVAQLVLSKVNQAPPPLDQNQRVILQNFVAASVTPEPSISTNVTLPEVKPEPIPVSSVQDLTAKNVTPMISYKNKLQEVCHKQKTNLPIYETVKDGNVYNCKVAIEGKLFTATGCKTKKGSEQSAARVALQALGLLDE